MTINDQNSSLRAFYRCQAKIGQNGQTPQKWSKLDEIGQTGQNCLKWSKLVKLAKNDPKLLVDLDSNDERMIKIGQNGRKWSQVVVLG